MHAEHAISRPAERIEEVLQAKQQIAAIPVHWSIRLGRAAWIVLALATVYLLIMSLPARWDQLIRPYPVVRSALGDLGMSVDFYAVFTISVEIFMVLVFWSVAMVIFWFRGRDWMGLYLSSMLFVIGPASYPISPMMETLAQTDQSYTFWVHLLNYYAWTCVFVFFCVFPTGKFEPRWSVGLAVFGALINIVWDLFPYTPWSPWNWPLLPFIVLELGMWGTCLFVQAYRYKFRSGPLQKQQTKWVVLGLMTAVTGCLALYMAHVLYPPFSAPNATGILFDIVRTAASYVFMLFFPATVLVAILRYRLWNIDLIINRTLVYIPLTGILAGLYAASITLFQKMFVAFTGAQSDAAIVMTTLILASLFTPIKNGLQSLVDKRFKDAPDKALKSMSDQMESFLWLNDPELIAQHVLNEASTAFGAESGAVYVESMGHQKILAEYGDWQKTDAAITIPMMCKRKRVGSFYLGERHHDEPYTERDRATLNGIVEMLTLTMERCKGHKW